MGFFSILRGRKKEEKEEEGTFPLIKGRPTPLLDLITGKKKR